MIILKKQILAGTLALSIVISGTIVFADTETPNIPIEKSITQEKISVKENNDIKPIKEEQVIPRMVIGDKTIDLKGFNPYYKGDTLMGPLRTIAKDALGFEVTWNNEERSVELKNGAQWTKMKLGENSYFFARVAPFELSEAPELNHSITFVPIEFFSQVLKYEVSIEDGNLIIKNDNIEKEDSTKKEQILHGFVKRIVETGGKKAILVGGGESTTGIDEILLHVNEDTQIVDKEGKTISVDDLKVGTKVEVTLPEIMTMSLPPQGTAIKIVVKEKESFQIEEKESKDDKKKMAIKYPQIKGMQDKLIENSLNKEIENFINSIKGNDLYKNLELDYEISLLGNEKISILFKGSFDGLDGKGKSIIKSLNFDLNSSNEITFDNYFKSDKDSKEKLKALLDKKAKENGLTEFEAEGVSIYFKGSNVVVYYYPLDDSYTSPVELHLQLEEIKDIVNTNFGKHPVS